MSSSERPTTAVTSARKVSRELASSAAARRMRSSAKRKAFLALPLDLARHAEELDKDFDLGPQNLRDDGVCR